MALIQCDYKEREVWTQAHTEGTWSQEDGAEMEGGGHKPRDSGAPGGLEEAGSELLIDSV